MPRLSLAVFALSSGLAATLPAQDTTKTPTAKMAGNWDVNFTSPQGTANWRVNFVQSGDTLSGSAQTDFGQLTVTDGWISGNDLSFTLNLNFNGTPVTLNFYGVVKGDTATGKIELPGVGMQPLDFTARRASSSGEPGPSGSALVAGRPRYVARPSAVR